MAIVRMTREKRDSVGEDNDVKKCETCLRRVETLMQIRLNSEKFRGACNGGRANWQSQPADWLAGNATAAKMPQEQWTKNNGRF